MKKLFTALLILFSYFSFCQLEYVELPDHNKERYNIQHVYEDGVVLATTNYPLALFMSQNNGASWENIAIDNIEDFYPSRSRFHMNFDNQYFISIESRIYRLDEATSTLSIFFAFNDEYENIEDFGFFPNGNLVVAENRSFRLFDENLNLLKEHDWWTHSANILIGENGKNYVTNSHGASDEILEFSHDLINISSEIPFYSDRGGIFYVNERLFISRGYSDDGGVTLENYNLPDNNTAQKVSVKDNKVALISFDGIYLSTDYGNTFEQIVGGVFNSNIDLYLFLENGVFYTSSDAVESSIIVSQDDGISFNEYDLSLGNEYVNNTATDYSGNVVAISDNNIQTFDPITSSWGMISSEICYYNGEIISQANGSIIKGGCISYNGGKNWEDSGNYFGYQMFDRNEILYDLDYYISRSNDFGISWQRTFTDLEDNFFLLHLTMTSNGDLIALDDGFYGNSLNYYFKDGGSTTIDMLNLNLQDVISAYSSTEVYYKFSSWNSQDALFISLDGYSDLTQLTLPQTLDYDFKVTADFLNNVYIYSENQIFVSKDLGSTWEDISPDHDDIVQINNVTLGRDLHLYISTVGTSVLKSIEPLGRLKELEVVLFEDTNMNCEFDQDEELLSGFEVNLNDKIRKITNSSTSIIFNTVSLENEMNISINADLYDVCEYDNSVVFTQDIDNAIRYIPITIKKECSELELNGSISILRRCFENSYSFDVMNVGSVIAENIEVDILLDEYFEFISTDVTIVSQSGQDLRVSIDNIPPNSSKRFKVKFLLSCDAELGEAHYMNASVEMQNPCYEESISTAFECRENIGSFDPNDKQTLISGVTNVDILPEGESLEYLIRFQNTGTDTAFTVRVEDRLASAFDLETFKIVSASHDYKYEIDRRKLIVTFDNILLPDSTTNEEGSNGFVKFKVDIIEDYTKGYNFKNNADIYFDFNDPIRTNTTLNYYVCKNESTVLYDSICPGENSYGFTEAGFYYGDLETYLGCDSSWYLSLYVREELSAECQPTSVVNQDANIDIIAYPNPSKGIIYFKTDNHKVISAKVYNSTGQSLGIYKVENNRVEIDAPSGIYFLELMTNEGLVTKEKVVLIKE